jgi:hypothetical protein
MLYHIVLDARKARLACAERLFVCRSTANCRARSVMIAQPLYPRRNNPLIYARFVLASDPQNGEERTARGRLQGTVDKIAGV